MRRPTQTTVSAASVMAGSSSGRLRAVAAAIVAFSAASRWRERARRFVAPRRLVDVGGDHRVGLDADLRQQRQAARRAGSEDEAGALGVGHAALLTREASMAFRAYLNR